MLSHPEWLDVFSTIPIRIMSNLASSIIRAEPVLAAMLFFVDIGRFAKLEALAPLII